MSESDRAMFQARFDEANEAWAQWQTVEDTIIGLTINCIVYTIYTSE